MIINQISTSKKETNNEPSTFNFILKIYSYLFV